MGEEREGGRNRAQRDDIMHILEYEITHRSRRIVMRMGGNWKSSAASRLSCPVSNDSSRARPHHNNMNHALVAVITHSPSKPHRTILYIAMYCIVCIHRGSLCKNDSFK